MGERDTGLALRALIAEIVGLDPAVTAELADDTPLLDGQIGLSSRGGARLLTEIRERFGVDVAGEDLALRALATIGTLTAFVDPRRP
jgi:acyl carrier protein